MRYYIVIYNYPNIGDEMKSLTTLRDINSAFVYKEHCDTYKKKEQYQYEVIEADEISN